MQPKISSSDESSSEDEEETFEDEEEPTKTPQKKVTFYNLNICVCGS